MGNRATHIGIVGASLAAAVGLALVGSPAQAQRQQGGDPPALVDVGAQASTSGVHVTAARHVEVDTSLLTPGTARTVSVDVIDTTLRVDLQPQASGAPGWSAWNGSIAGQPDSSATVVRNGDDVSGIFTTAEGSYRIRTVAPGEQVVQTIGGSFPEPVDDAVTPTGTLDLGTPDLTNPDVAKPDVANPDLGTTEGSQPDAAADVPVNPVIDVLVGYTPDALSYAGGISAMNSEIALSISVTNTAYADSGVSGRVRLAGTTALSENLTLSNQSLSWLTGTSDGHSDQVHAQRNNTGADLVSVLTDDGTSCGLAWLLDGLSSAPAQSPYGFSVVDFPCAVDNYSFPHELGHNMGLDHDRYVEPNPTLFPYAVGYVNTVGKWRTIMAYNTQCADLGFNCTRLGRFSNPDQTYLGAPLGRPSTGPTPADNRKALNNTHGFVASWRAKPAPFTSWSKFVAQQYRDFVGRAPSSSESATATNNLNQGITTPQAYIDGLLNGPFGSSYAPVTRLYFAYFLRSPDIGGLDYWVGKYRTGTKLTAISSNFAASSEFKNKYGQLSNRAFVNKIYDNLFDRTGDSGGVNYWTAKLDSKSLSRGQVMVNFSESSEFKRVRAEEISVVMLYRSMLRRSATAGEFSSQVARLQGSTTVRRMILEIMDSAEYTGRIVK